MDGGLIYICSDRLALKVIKRNDVEDAKEREKMAQLTS